MQEEKYETSIKQKSPQTEEVKFEEQIINKSKDSRDKADEDDFEDFEEANQDKQE